MIWLMEGIWRGYGGEGRVEDISFIWEGKGHI